MAALTPDAAKREAPLEPFEALRAEFEALGFVDPDAKTVDWRFVEADVRDADALAQQLRCLGGFDHDHVAVPLLVKRLNELLEWSPAATWSHLASFLRTPRARALRRTALAIRSTTRRETDHSERINRRLVELAFPDVVRTINDRELERLFSDQKARTTPRIALALSGGGIRSATFALGVLRALAERQRLGALHYLSTVSGGGYIGSWLAAWMARESRYKLKTPPTVEEQLRQPRGTIIDPEASAVHHLRLFSSYLSPRLGLFSADAWTLGATVARNLLLIWIVVIPVILGAFLVPHVIYILSSIGFDIEDWPTFVLIGLGLACGVSSVEYVHRHRTHGGSQAGTRGRTDGARSDFLARCLMPITVAVSAFGMLWNNAYIRGFPPLEAPYGIAGFVAIAVVGACVHLVGWALSSPVGRWSRRLGEGLLVVVTGALAGAGANGIMLGLQELAYRSSAVGTMALSGPLVLITLTTPTLLLALAVAGFIYEGGASRWHDERHREWNSRYSAWLLLVAAGWLAAFVVTISLPRAIDDQWKALGAFIGGIAFSWFTAAVGKSAKEPARRAARMTIPSVALAVAAPLGVVLCLVAIGWLNIQIAKDMLRGGMEPEGFRSAILVLGWALGLAIFGALAGACVDTNKFSLHAMYRSRLVRAYLGASRRQGARRPDPFTDFDTDDEVRMADLVPPAPDRTGEAPVRCPLLVVNTTLNLASGEDLSWRERRGESFVITPFHAGAWSTGYRLTSGGERLYGSPHGGISLGTAITISGAAASPNMGYHSTPAVTFLMALFNARLGWWLGNPGWPGERTFYRSYPSRFPLPIFPIFREMFGRTNDIAPYVYLSDGGHFENLGIYEMVARRCRLIIAVDASCDPKCEFGDLGTAIQRIWADFGVPVEFSDKEHPLDMRAHGGAKWSGHPWAVAHLRYSVVNPRHEDGILVYVKPGLYENAPAEVVAYARRHAAFPHESTADQFFSETQFACYQALGHHIGSAMLDATESVLVTYGWANSADATG